MFIFLSLFICRAFQVALGQYLPWCEQKGTLAFLFLLGFFMKISTWNVNSLKVRLPQVLAWLQTHNPDVLVLQELKQDQDQFPLQAIEQLGFQAAWYGQKTYNGVAIISKKTAANVDCGMANFADEQKRVIAATVDDVRVINVYCVNGESLQSDKFLYKEAWFAALQDYIKVQLSQYSKLVLLGDFNIAPSDLDVYDAQKWQNKILCSPQERRWYQSLLDLGLYDAIRTLSPDEPNFTWWDYRMNGFRRNLGLRIDHILLTENLMNQCTAFGIDKEARAAERPSDHAPVWVQWTA